MRKVVVVSWPSWPACSRASPRSPRPRRHESDQARLHRYAADLGVVRRHGGHAERPAHRPAARRRAAPTCRRRRPTSAPTCGAPSPPSGSASSATPSCVDPAPATIDDARATWSATSPTASSTTGTTTATARSSRPGRRPATRSTRSCPRSTTPGWRPGCGSCATPYPSCRARAGAIYDSMDFGFYYVPDENRILFHYSPADGTGPCCYDTVVSESRIADYIGIAKGELPRKEYYGRWRTFPDTLRLLVPGDQARAASPARYDGVSVYDGSLPVRRHAADAELGRLDVRGADAGAVRARGALGRGSWRQNHPLTVDAQIDHGLNVAGYGAWGFSPSNTPEGGYGAYGVDAAGMDPNGMPVERGRHARRPRLRRLPGPAREARPAAERVHERRGDAARRVPRAALPAAAPRWPTWRGSSAIPGDVRHVGLPRLGQRHAPDTRRDCYLSLDQGMIMAALGNALGDDVLRRAFATPDFRAGDPAGGRRRGVRRPPRGCTITGTRATTARGHAGADVICGLGGDDHIAGRGGDDDYRRRGRRPGERRRRRRHALRRRGRRRHARRARRRRPPAARAPTSSAVDPAATTESAAAGGGGRCHLERGRRRARADCSGNSSAALSVRAHLCHHGH